MKQSVKPHMLIRRQAFTLLEILLVIAGISILIAATIVVMNPGLQIRRTEEVAQKSSSQTIKTALNLYYLDNGQYPDSLSPEVSPLCGQQSQEQCLDVEPYLVPVYIATLPPDAHTIAVGLSEDGLLRFEEATADEEDDTPVAVQTFGEVGKFSSSNTTANGSWTSLTFNQSYQDPVVIGNVMQSGEPNSAYVFESQNVTSEGAQVRVCRTSGPNSQCLQHTNVEASYMVIDIAVVDMIDGVSAGRTTVSGRVPNNWTQVDFSLENASIFAGPQTVPAQFPIEIRVNEVNGTGFDLGVCYQQNQNNCQNNYPPTEAGWVAFSENMVLYNASYSLGQEQISDFQWVTIAFQDTKSSPVVFVENQSKNGSQSMEVNEVKNVSSTSAQIRFCQLNTESCSQHPEESVAWAAFEEGLLVGIISQ